MYSNLHMFLNSPYYWTGAFHDTIGADMGQPCQQTCRAHHPEQSGGDDPSEEMRIFSG